MRLKLTELALFFFVWCSSPLYAQEKYELSLDSKPQPGVPKGEIKGPFAWKSNLYPGTEREYWVYVPQQYDASKPACVMVVQDGLGCAEGWHLPPVLDNLIQKKEIPVLIGIFVRWGKVPAAGTEPYPRFNRSLEYDGMGDRYARFLIEEILPEVSKSYNLSNNPNDRSIAGASSGAICAFNAAWERPDAFRRVLSTIGTYVGLRGADEFPTLIRKTEPKPLRVFLQDGTSDLNIYAGDWYAANLDMLSALQFAGYEVEHNWGSGGHNSEHAAAIMPDALRWLWKDYPKPIENHKNTKVDRRIDLLLEGKEWTPVSTDGHSVASLAVNQAGTIFFTDTQSGAIFKTDGNGSISPFAQTKSAVGPMMFGADEKLYVGNTRQKTMLVFNQSGKSEVVLNNIDCRDLLVSRKGIYFTETDKGNIGFYDFASKKTRVFTEMKAPTGLSLSAEQTFLNVGSKSELFGYSLKVQEDGTLAFAQPYIHYHIPYGQSTPGVLGMTVDSENLLYSATEMGIQVSDQLGRVNFIFAKPENAALTKVAFAGNSFDELLVVCGGKLFRRQIKAKGILPWLAPVKPSKPGM